MTALISPLGRTGLHAVLACILAVLASAVFAPRPAHAWDVEATRLVGDLAYERLTPVAKARVDAILAAPGPDGDQGCRAGALADAPRLIACLRDHHADPLMNMAFDAISICPSAPPTRGCRDGFCASAMLKRAIAALKAPDTPPGARMVALETVVDLTAELHQPLHAADNGDRSGARFRVTLPGSTDKRLTLYSVWDEDLVAEAVGDESTGLPYLRPLADAHAAAWSQGGVDDWLADSRRVAIDDVYGRLPTPAPCNRAPDKPQALDRAYVAFGAQVVRSQIAKAGVRLAALLNSVLG